MKKLIIVVALATAVIPVPAIAASDGNYSVNYPQSSFAGTKPWQHAPDDYVTQLCVTCRHVHPVKPMNGEAQREGDTYCGAATCE